MDKTEFIKKFVDILQTESNITSETKLEDIEEWDSLSKMGTLAFLNKDFNLNLTFGDIEKFNTVNDMMNKAGV